MWKWWCVGVFAGLVGGGDTSAFGRSVSIMEIQGAAHTSPLAEQLVTVSGIVTVVRSYGFYLQDPLGDSDERTSEGLFVFTDSKPEVTPGDEVLVEGEVSEYRPGGSSQNLTITELIDPTVTSVSFGNPLPEPVVIGKLGRTPPGELIDDDGFTEFDPSRDGIDFYESLEGMRVRIPSPVAVSTTNRFGEFWVVADEGDATTGFSTRGAIVVGEGDFNPERIQIDDGLYSSAPPTVEVGDQLVDVVGVLSYRFGNYEVLPINAPLMVLGSQVLERTRLRPSKDHVTVASLNVNALHPRETFRIQILATIIAKHLRSPDVLTLQEIADDNGDVDNGVVDAGETYRALIAAIEIAGGPRYGFRDIPPLDGEDGGAPGANIRVGFLFNPTRVWFVDRGIGSSTTATTISSGESGPELTVSPGRIDPANAAWLNTRKSLVGEFEFNGKKLFVIANHFTSKLGSSPLFGSVQPPTDGGSAKRLAQATVVGEFVNAILSVDPHARVVVLGDFNEYWFQHPMRVLQQLSQLVNLTSLLPDSERYTFIFDGNAQALDHVLVSPSLMRGAEYDIVHTFSEFNDAPTDHDPVVARLLVGGTGKPESPAWLRQNSPNPFREVTKIMFEVPRSGRVVVEVFDVRGRRVRTIADRVLPAGEHTYTWNARSDGGEPVGCGIYFCRMRADNHNQSIKMVVVK